MIRPRSPQILQIRLSHLIEILFHPGIDVSEINLRAKGGRSGAAFQKILNDIES